MPIAKFLTHLQELNKKLTISVGGVILREVHISWYDINPDNSLMIYTKERHEIYVDLDNFKEIAFDPIVLSAPKNNTIEYCLSNLAPEKSFIAYFFDINEKTIVAFHSFDKDEAITSTETGIFSYFEN
jgi:hypothetical protein